MTITIDPTLQAQYWGDDAQQLYDYYPHATRDPYGNPLIIFRHVGGGVGGNYQTIWTASSRFIMWFFEYVHNTTSLGLHFDIVSVSTAQRQFDANYLTGKKTFILGQAQDMQRCIVAMKRLGRIGFGSSNQYKVDPKRIILFGESHGSNICSLSQLMPPYVENSMRVQPTYGEAEPGLSNYHRVLSSMDTSNVAGVVYYVGQPDVRTGCLTYNNLGGFWGASVTDGGTQFAAVPEQAKRAASTQWYIEQGLTRFYCPHFVIYPTVAGSKPYSNSHSSQQGVDLAAALAAKNLPYQALNNISESFWLSAGSNYHPQLYQWMERTINAYATAKPSTIGSVV